MASSSERKAWSIDQLTKSEFFHLKLHEWGLLEVAQQIEQVKGETLSWDKEKLGISQKAWDKVIHRGIKPVIVLAHPQVLTSIRYAVSYYRMLAMVSQKSMIRVGLPTTRYEQQDTPLDLFTAQAIARHLNKIICHLVEADEEMDAREFDLWRGMAAGSQAQGSWQNTKGSRIEFLVKGIIQRRLREKRLVSYETDDSSRMALKDGRTFEFSDEPDIGVYQKGNVTDGGSWIVLKDKQTAEYSYGPDTGVDQKGNIEVAVEIKGGIDTAGVLERIGAAIKSLSRAKEENPNSTTILILQGVSLTDQARNDLKINQSAVNHWFTVEDVLEDEKKNKELFKLLAI